MNRQVIAEAIRNSLYLSTDSCVGQNYIENGSICPMAPCPCCEIAADAAIEIVIEEMQK